MATGSARGFRRPMTRIPSTRSALLALAALLAATSLLAFAGTAFGNAARSHRAQATAHRHGHGARHRRRRRHRHRNLGPKITGSLTLSSGRTIAAPPVPAGPCPNADLEPSSGNLAQIDQATLCLINKQRIANGLAALAENAKLDAAAASHNNDMLANDYFDHVSPSGSTPLDRTRAVGYILAGAGYEIGENIATGSTGLDTPSEIVNEWMNSPGHRANILDADYTETGVAAAAAMPASAGGGLAGATYTQDFGVIS
jgi:uncharacterized protein YkwD